MYMHVCMVVYINGLCAWFLWGMHLQPTTDWTWGMELLQTHISQAVRSNALCFFS